MGKRTRFLFVVGLMCGLPAFGLPQTVHEAWVRQYPDVDTCAHGFSAMTVDSAGNVYVTGAGRLPGRSDYDFLTKKISPSGLTLWEARYDGPGHGDDRAADLRIDGAGNVYVTGNSVGAGTFVDFATVKYDATGIEQWVARKAGTGSTVDHVYGMGIGENGDVVVFGYTEDSSGHQIGEIVKYTTNGSEEWSVLDTLFADVGTIDRLGNVYVSGYAYTTARYGPDGSRHWKRDFHPLPGSFFPSALEVDETGSVYVNGTSFDLAAGEAYSWAVKWNSAGVQQWYKQDTHAGTNVLHLDSTLVYLSAGSDLVCLSRNGTQQWSVDCASDSVFNIVAFVMGRSKDIVVAGSLLDGHRLPSASFSISGGLNWAHRNMIAETVDLQAYNSLYALDQAGDLFVSLNNGSTIQAPITEEFASAGDHRWTEPAQYGTPLAPTASLLDKAGNLYVTGMTFNPGTLNDFLTVKYDSTGLPLWGVRYNGPADSLDSPTAIALDVQGNVYVTGQSRGVGTGADYVTIKYSATGRELWTARYNGPASADDVPSSLAVDSLGYVYVTGRSWGTGGNWDFATLKYTPAGLLQWVNRYDGPTSGDDKAQALAVDVLRNVYVTGQSDSLGSGTDITTIKYDTFGQRQWVRRYDGPARGVDVPVALAINPAGDVIVSGYSDGVGTQVDYATVQYSPTGTQGWIERYDDSVHSADIGQTMTIGDDGSIVVAGSSTGGGNAEDFMTVEYDSSGTRKWVASFDGTGHGTDVPTRTAADDSGNVYVAGTSYSSYGTSDLVTLKYDHSGNEIWHAHFTPNSQISPVPRGMDVDRFANVYLSAMTGYGNDAIWTIVKYVQSPPLVAATEAADRPAATILWQNYPNPFNPKTVVSFQTTAADRVRLIVYDVLGREVETLVDEMKAPGRYSVTWDASKFASGVYFYRIVAGIYMSTKRMVVLK
jgi:hypothetical protein